MKKTLVKKYSNSQLSVELDRSQVFPDDPGQGTPAVVYLDCPSGRFSATYWCAIGEGSLYYYNHRGEEFTKKLTDKQMEWLDEIERELDEFLYKQEKTDA